MSAAPSAASHDGGSASPDAVLRALADPQRRLMLRLVRSNELASGEIATHFDITQQAVSHHLHHKALPRPPAVRHDRRGARESKHNSRVSAGGAAA